MNLSRLTRILTAIWLRIATPRQSGQSGQQACSNVTESCVPVPLNVSTISAPADSSTEKEKPMSLTLSTIATALTTVASAIKASETIYDYAAQLISVAETAYESTSGSGAAKKEAVMAALKAVAAQLGEEWDAIKSAVSSWIDMVIQTWNTLKATLTGSDSDADDASQTASEQVTADVVTA